MTEPNGSRASISAVLCVAVVVTAVGLFGSEYHRHVFVLTALAAILAIGFDILFGLAGQVAIAQGAFFGVGAYASALLVMKAGIAPLPAMAIAVILNVVLAALVALPAVRVKGEYLLLLSLGFAVVVYELLLNLVDLTGGPMGMSGVPSLGQFNLFGLSIDFARKSHFLWLAGAIVIAAVLIASALRRSYLGRSLRAVRDDADVAAATGINVAAALIAAFAISAAFASVAGSLYAHYLRILDPSSFTILLSVEVLLMCVIGGRDSTWGPLLGAFLVAGLPEIFRPFAEYRLVVFGVCIVIVMLFLPNGLASLAGRLAQLLRSTSSENGGADVGAARS